MITYYKQNRQAANCGVGANKLRASNVQQQHTGSKGDRDTQGRRETCTELEKHTQDKGDNMYRRIFFHLFKEFLASSYVGAIY